MTQISKIVDSGIVYDFEPPVEIGDQKVTTIADVTRIAMRGSELVHPVVREAINLQVDTLLGALDELAMKETALNQLLAGKHEVRVSTTL